MSKEKILLIDGFSILNRAYYGVPTMVNSKGIHTNGIHGFLNIVSKEIEEEKPDYALVAFDLPKPTFRHEMYEEYKGTRTSKPDEFKMQIPILQKLLPLLNIPILTKEGYEADDIIGTIARVCDESNLDVSILSGDKDLLQLATDNVKIRMTKGKGEIVSYYSEDVKNQYGVYPKEFIDVKALMGDSSDNIKGVPGIGEKTAVKIISTYGSIENAYDHVDELKPAKASKNLKEYWEDAKMSKVLVTIDTNVELDFELASCKQTDFIEHEAILMLKELELKYILKKLTGIEL